MNTPTRHALMLGVLASVWLGFSGALLIVSAIFGESVNLLVFGIIIGGVGLIPLYSGAEDYEPRHRRFVVLTAISLVAIGGLFAVADMFEAQAAAKVGAGDLSFQSPALLATVLEFAGSMVFGLPFVLPVYHIFEVEERRLLRLTLMVFLVVSAATSSLILWLTIDAVAATSAEIAAGFPARPLWDSAQSYITVAQTPIFIMLLPFSLIFVRAYLKAKRMGQARIDDIFIIANDGRLMHHATRRLEPSMDYDILAGMFKAVLDFMKDSFSKKSGQAVTGFEMGDYYIAVQHGAHVSIALACNGVPHEMLREKLRRVLAALEGKHAAGLKEWDGNRESVRPFIDGVIGELRLSRIA